MGLNIKAINEALSKTPLCRHALIAQKGMAVEYCAMGAIAKACGVSDEELKHHDAAGISLFKELHIQLLNKFGIETLAQFQNLMSANDGARNSATRNNEVKSKATLMAVDEVVSLFREAEFAGRTTSDGE